jgi:hypothetical protein
VERVSPAGLVRDMALPGTHEGFAQLHPGAYASLGLGVDNAR